MLKKFLLLLAMFMALSLVAGLAWAGEIDVGVGNLENTEFVVMPVENMFMYEMEGVYPLEYTSDYIDYIFQDSENDWQVTAFEDTDDVFKTGYEKGSSITYLPDVAFVMLC